MTSQYQLAEEHEVAIRAALLETYFKFSSARPDKEQVAKDLQAHVRGRFDLCNRWLIPWVENHVDLAVTDVVEIGCGTGSTTAAVALKARSVHAYDIAGISVEAARRRLQVLGLHNATVHEHAPDELLSAVVAAHAPNSVEMILCFAVLEHAKHGERLATLRTCWDLLAPGGILVIGDTPNRLGYWDHHTAWMPFFHSLPTELALDYASRSPRESFAKGIEAAKARSYEIADDYLARAGRGISYHEFELALGDLDPLIVGDGFDPEPMSFFGINLETRFLYSYGKLKGLNVHPAFLRSSVEVILQKPGGTNVRPSRPRDLDKIIAPLRI